MVFLGIFWNLSRHLSQLTRFEASKIVTVFTIFCVIISFEALLSLLCFLFLFVDIPKAGLDAKRKKRRENETMLELPYTQELYSRLGL